MHVIFVGEGSFIRNKTVKTGGVGQFAECNTRQRGPLPSILALTLGKEASFCFSGFFLPSVQCLPSVKAKTLGKNVDVCRVYWL